MNGYHASSALDFRILASDEGIIHMDGFTDGVGVAWYRLIIGDVDVIVEWNVLICQSIYWGVYR